MLVDLSPYVNASWTPLSNPVGFVTLGGVPFHIASDGHGYAGVYSTAFSPSPQTLTVPVSIQGAKTVYTFSNSTHAGLGDQLPAGVLRFYLRDKHGDPQFIGESRIDHTPMGSVLSLQTGDAFDVKVKPVVEKRIRIDFWHYETQMRYELSNALPRAVTVRLLQGGLYGDSRITAESAKSTRRDAETAEWAVTVPPNGNTTVTATFDTRY